MAHRPECFAGFFQDDRIARPTPDVGGHLAARFAFAPGAGQEDSPLGQENAGLEEWSQPFAKPDGRVELPFLGQDQWQATEPCGQVVPAVGPDLLEEILIGRLAGRRAGRQNSIRPLDRIAEESGTPHEEGVEWFVPATFA